MNDLLAIFTTYNFILLCGGIITMTFIARTIIEYFWLNNPKLPGNRDNRFFTALFLPLFPVVLGVLFGIFGKGFPDQVNNDLLKFAFGSSAGLLAPIIYQVVKGMLWNFVPMQIQMFMNQLGEAGLNKGTGTDFSQNIDVNVNPPVPNPNIIAPSPINPQVNITNNIGSTTNNTPSVNIPPPNGTPPTA